MALYDKTAHELHDLLAAKEITAVEILESVFQRICEVDSKVRAYITLTYDQAKSEAERVDRLIAKGKDVGILAGIPIAIKDNISTKGIKTTCASKILEDYIPPYDAFVVERVKQKQMIISGKTNLDEFAMGSSTENSGFFLTRNPWNPEMVPGGSSGGSAVAVGAGETILALGSDTGGSIRLPAGYCGIVGLKPTYGRVSRFGLVAYASSLDQIGPMTKDVTDCALLLQAIAGRDPQDSTSVNYPVPNYLEEMKQSIKGLKIGVAKEYLAGVSEPVAAVIANSVQVFKELGAEILEISLPHTEYAIAAYSIIASAEAASNLSRYDGARYGYRTTREVSNTMELFLKTRAEGFGPEVKRRIVMGTYLLSSDCYEVGYLKAQKTRSLIRDDFNNAFLKCDLILTPTAPTTAFKIDAKIKGRLEMSRTDTITANLAGIPALSIPGGFDRGMPIGIQLLGPAFREELLLRAAYGFEQATGFHKLRPDLGVRHRNTGDRESEVTAVSNENTLCGR